MASSPGSRRKKEVVQSSDRISNVSLGIPGEGVDGGTLYNMISTSFDGVSIEERFDDDPAS